MQTWGVSFLLGATALLAGCSGSSSTSGTPNPTQTSSTLTVSTTSLPSGTVGAAYTAAVAASGGTTPYTYNATNLPGGLSISASTGMITGIPAQNSVGTAATTVKVTDSTQPSSQSASSSLSISISPAASPAALAVTTTSLPGGTVSVAYPSTSLQASGGVPPYSWSLQSGSMPAGLNLSAAGAISGTPTAAGAYPLTFVVTDSSSTPETAKASLTLTISAAPTSTLTLTTTTLA